jgi:toxin FitB
VSYLADANVLSEATKPQPDPRVIDWLRRISCLPWDTATGLRWAKLLADLRAAGRSMPVKDSLIAATALEHDRVVVTRNGRDFANAGVRLLDPFR